jgi:hypothetical protein
MFHVPVRQPHRGTWHLIDIICCVDEMHQHTRTPGQRNRQDKLKRAFAQQVQSRNPIQVQIGNYLYTLDRISHYTSLLAEVSKVNAASRALSWLVPLDNNLRLAADLFRKRGVRKRPRSGTGAGQLVPVLALKLLLEKRLWREMRSGARFTSLRLESNHQPL